MASVIDVERLLARGDVQGLCRALRETNVLVRRRAVQALGELQQPAGVPCLARALHRDRDQYVIRWSVESLRQIGDETAIHALTAAAFGADRRIASLAAQALAAIPDSRAASAVGLREILLRNDVAALDRLGEEGRPALGIILRSEQYTTWPSGKRKQVLSAGVRLGASLPQQYTRELADMGLFVSGVHTLGDLLAGLGSRNPEVRIAAAEKLGSTGKWWAKPVLYHRFRQEARPGGDRSVAAAIARTLAHLDDRRGITHYKEQLYSPDALPAAEAARALAEIGTGEAIQTLFWFAAEPPPPPAYRNISQVFLALESAGPALADALRLLVEHPSSHARLVLVEVLSRCRQPETMALLGRLGRDPDPGVQRAALDGLAGLNTPAAADTLYALADAAPHDWVARALTAITHPVSLGYLRKLAPNSTTVQGIVLEDDGQPLSKAHVQIVREHFFGEQAGWGWLAISSRAETEPSGAFALAVLDAEDHPPVRLKVTTSPGGGKDGETFLADLPLTWGRASRVQARIDRFFARLVLTVKEDTGEDALISSG